MKTFHMVSVTSAIIICIFCFITYFTSRGSLESSREYAFMTQQQYDIECEAVEWVRGCEDNDSVIVSNGTYEIYVEVADGEVRKWNLRRVFTENNDGVWKGGLE